jgi:RimJ/RimL family protein N-acetyltransferase
MQGLSYFYPIMILSVSDSIALRPLTIADAPGFAIYANNRKVSDNLRDAFPKPYTLDDAERFIHSVEGSTLPNVLGIEFNQEIIGSVGIYIGEDIYRFNAEIGYWIAEPFWGLGITTKVVEAMTAYAFENFPIERLFARPFPFNISSIRVLEKCGYIHEATLKNALVKQGHIYDELIFSKLK